MVNRTCSAQFNISRKRRITMINGSDTGWVLISTALVMLMTAPGLALFYGGLVRRKNVLSTIMQSFFMLCLISITWVLFGYSLSFGPDIGHLIGGLQWLGFKDVGLTPNADYSGTIPHMLFALITGAFAERMKFSAFVLFSLLWSTLVYAPLCHWVWGVGGWLRNLGALDFAGGTVVHISSGISALVCALVLGRRKNINDGATPPHNMVLTMLGAALLWFGWFGFNAGSALSPNEIAVNAFTTTNTATAAAALTWLVLEWIISGKPTALGAATGAVAGLVAITPACGFVSPLSAILIGILVGLVCYFAVTVIKHKLGYDDSLDAFGVHGIGGITGALATGLFASKLVNGGGSDGLFFGNPGQLGTQAIAVGTSIVFAGVMTFILLKVVNAVVGLRVNEEEEIIGLDNTQHKESAYTLLD
jgi:Amt family ammonium transporter